MPTSHFPTSPLALSFEGRPPSLPPPSYNDAISNESTKTQWNLFESALGRKSLFRPQSRQTPFPYAHLLSTSLPPVFPPQDEELVTLLLLEFEASLKNGDAQPERVRMCGERIIGMRRHYKEAGRLDLAEILAPISAAVREVLQGLRGALFHRDTQYPEPRHRTHRSEIQARPATVEPPHAARTPRAQLASSSSLPSPVREHGERAVRRHRTALRRTSDSQVSTSGPGIIVGQVYPRDLQASPQLPERSTATPSSRLPFPVSDLFRSTVYQMSRLSFPVSDFFR